MNGRNLKKGSFKKEEDAVSPVIGVILMVAITVILAAVIGAFVFGMGGSVSKTYTIGVTAAQTGADTIDVTFQGGPDADVVDCINVSVGSIAFPGLLGTADGVTLPVGTTATLTDNSGNGTIITDGRDHLIATATFVDGSQQVVLDTYV
jgi:flagellin-like protein